MNLRTRLDAVERAVDARAWAFAPPPRVAACHRLGELFGRVARRLAGEGRPADAERFTRLADGLAGIRDDAEAQRVADHLKAVRDAAGAAGGRRE